MHNPYATITNEQNFTATRWFACSKTMKRCIILNRPRSSGIIPYIVTYYYFLFGRISFFKLTIIQLV